MDESSGTNKGSINIITLWSYVQQSTVLHSVAYLQGPIRLIYAIAHTLSSTFIKMSTSNNFISDINTQLYHPVPFPIHANHLFKAINATICIRQLCTSRFTTSELITQGLHQLEEMVCMDGERDWVIELSVDV